MITLNATYQQTKRVVDSVAGIYQTVLTIDPLSDNIELYSCNIELYSCTVENARGRSRTVVVAGAS